MFYCTGIHIEKCGYVTVPVTAKKRDENFDLMSAFGLEMPEGEIKVKINHENKSAEEDGSSKKRRFAVVERS